MKNMLKLFNKNKGHYHLFKVFLTCFEIVLVNLTMYFTEPQNKTIQERQLDLPVNKLEFLAFNISGRAGTSSYERILINI